MSAILLRHDFLLLSGKLYPQDAQGSCLFYLRIDGDLSSTAPATMYLQLENANGIKAKRSAKAHNADGMTQQRDRRKVVQPTRVASRASYASKPEDYRDCEVGPFAYKHNELLS